MTAHAIHDFSSKLRQPGVAERLEEYVSWRRELARARSTDSALPPAPAFAPVSINLDLTTACNFRCDHCIDWDILNTKHKHDEKILRDSIVNMRERGLRSVILIGGGEPTLYPGFSDFVGFLKELDLQVAVVSNGSRGDRLLAAAEHLDAHDWIRLSLDAGSNELFRSMHKPVSPDLDLDEICSWVGRIKQANPKPRIGFSYIIVWHGALRIEAGADVQLEQNIDEIVLATRRARDAGFDYISLKPVLERAEDGAEVMQPGRADDAQAVVARIRREVDEARALATETFSVYESVNLRVLEKESWRELCNQPRTCHMQAFRQVLTPTGLFNCPAHRGVEKARLGDADAWGDEERMQGASRSLGHLLDGFDAHAECAEVTCLYNGVNWWIEGMIEDPRTGPVVSSAAGAAEPDYFL